MLIGSLVSRDFYYVLSSSVYFQYQPLNDISCVYWYLVGCYSSPNTTPTTFTTRSGSGLCPVLHAIDMMTIIKFVFVLDKKLLKKSYDMLILTLAIGEALTAVQLITNPAYVLGDKFPYSSHPFVGEIFCRIIWSRVFVFRLVPIRLTSCCS